MADVAEEQGLRAIELGKSLGPLARVLLRASVGNGCFQVTRNESVKSPRFLQWPHGIGAGNEDRSQVAVPVTGYRQRHGAPGTHIRPDEPAYQRVHVVNASSCSRCRHYRELPGIISPRKIDKHRHGVRNRYESHGTSKSGPPAAPLDEIEEGERQVAR